MSRGLMGFALAAVLAGGASAWAAAAPQQAAAADDLAERLLRAGTEDERRKLLETEKDRVTPALAQVLRSRGDRLLGEGRSPDALAAFALAAAVYERA